MNIETKPAALFAALIEEAATFDGCEIDVDENTISLLVDEGESVNIYLDNYVMLADGGHKAPFGHSTLAAYWAERQATNNWA